MRAPLDVVADGRGDLVGVQDRIVWWLAAGSSTTVASGSSDRASSATRRGSCARLRPATTTSVGVLSRASRSLGGRRVRTRGVRATSAAPRT
ncbi:hypothetical protein E4P41_07050 [Geodermatophilus sp. DF01-2]|nr:hypothetical protein E4P41_07050 [Geodermatophilus sp. DF01_2]